MLRRFPFITVLGVISRRRAGRWCGRLWRKAARRAYPDQPIRVIVSVPAGGGVDTITRIVTAQDARCAGPAAGRRKQGRRRRQRRRRSGVQFGDPDGYTILASQPSPITTNPFLYKSLNYDPTQLMPVAIMSHVPNVLLVRKDFPANNVAGIDRLCQSQSRQNQLRFAGHRHDVTHDRRTVPDDHPHQARPCALQGHRAGRSPICSPAMST